MAPKRFIDLSPIEIHNKPQKFLLVVLANDYNRKVFIGFRWVLVRYRKNCIKIYRMFKKKPEEHSKDQSVLMAKLLLELYKHPEAAE